MEDFFIAYGKILQIIMLLICYISDNNNFLNDLNDHHFITNMFIVYCLFYSSAPSRHRKLHLLLV